MDIKNHRLSLAYAPYIAAILFFLPFILNNAAFNDDFYKQLWGESHFMQDGRPVAEVVLRIFSLSNFSVDNVAPLTWIVSIILLGWVCTFLGNKLHAGNNTILIFSSLIFCTPAFIENAFFKFDNLTMSIAISFSVIASCIKIKSWGSFSLVCALCLGFLCSYQLAMTAYIILSILMFVNECMRGEDDRGNLLDILLKAISLAVAFMVYAALKSLMPISKYAMDQGSISAPVDILSIITPGFVKYTSLLLSIYDVLSLVAIAALAVISFLSVSLYALKKIRSNKSIYAYASALVMTISVPLSFIMIFAPLMILKSQPDYLRLLIGLGAFVFMIAYFSYLSASENRYAKVAVLTLALIPAVDAISKSYIINNAYAAQHSLTDGISIGVLNSLSSSGIDRVDEIKYTTHGPVSYETERVMKDYPFTRKILRGGYVAIPHWAGYEHQSKIKVGEWVTDKQNKDACTGLQIARHLNYDVYVQNKIAFVDLTKERCKNFK
ncbi:glucosyltransferase domain-containing protein [Enterobacter soli]